MNKTVLRIATLGHVGWLPIAPGTWGSGVAVVIWWLLLANQGLTVQVSVIVPIAVIAVWSSGVAEKTLGHDAKQIVIDEVAGQWIALVVCSGIVQFGLAFILFRLFDVWKPFPINKSQNLPGGWGIVIDDILAGGLAAIALSIIKRYI